MVVAQKTTFVKLDRNIVDWRWFRDSSVLHVFIWLLLKANVKDHAFQREIIPRGSLATSYETIAEACGMSRSSVQRALSRLEQTGEIERSRKWNCQVVKIVGYEEYQNQKKGVHTEHSLEHSLEQSFEHSFEHSLEHQYKNNKNIKNIKNEKNPPKPPMGASRPSGRERYPCGLSDKPEWMTEEEWDTARYMTADDIPGLYRGDYDSVIDYLLAKKRGVLD